MKKRPLVLLLNDEPGVLDLLEFLFEEAGFQSLRATKDQEALALLREHSIYLLVQDVLRPDGDGRAFYETLKKDKKLRKIPVLFTTASSMESLDSVSESMRVFGDGYIEVPFDIQDFLAVVKKILVRHKKVLASKFNLDLSKV